MTVESNSNAQSGSNSALLNDPRYELMPFENFGEQIEYLPEGAEVTITASPQLELEATIEWAEKTADCGFEVIPHVSARYVRDKEHLTAIAKRLRAVGVTDIFIPGGDREEPIGEFESAYDLLVALEDIDYEFKEIGITGYPEGHPFLSDETLAESMEKKTPYATYITTQLCYDPETIVEWIEQVRDRGVTLPVEVGIPGVMNYQKLLKISQKVGVGDSMRFLKKTTGILGFIRQMIGSRGVYKPDDIVTGLAGYADDPEYAIRGLHIYTFNQVSDIESWRTKRLRSS